VSLTKYRERIGIPNDVDDDVAFNIFKSGGEVIISKVVESGVDLCPHEWEEIEEKREISRGLGCKVYRCIKGCLRFVFHSRSSLGKWLWGYRSFPKIAGKLPTEGYYSDDWFHRKFGMNPQTVSDYYKLTEGLDIDGAPAYIKTDEGRVFFYRDDPKETAPTNSKRTILDDILAHPLTWFFLFDAAIVGVWMAVNWDELSRLAQEGWNNLCKGWNDLWGLNAQQAPDPVGDVEHSPGNPLAPTYPLDTRGVGKFVGPDGIIDRL